MARKPRVCPPFSVQHIIFRFLDKRYRFVDEIDRRLYLELFGEEARQTSWRFISYSLMSSHGHFGSLVGAESLKCVFHRPHSRFALRWHKRHGGLGPVFADRPANHRVRPERTAELIAYNHMDPVRNGVVNTPSESEWTSHRAYLRLAPAPPWLDVSLGLQMCGFDDREADRKRFDDFVQSCHRRHWQRDPFDFDNNESQPTTSNATVIDLADSASRTHQMPSCETIVANVADSLGMQFNNLGISTRRPSNDVARLRRTAAWIAVAHFGYRQHQIAESLHVSPQAIGKMLKYMSGDVLAHEIIRKITNDG